MTRSHFVTDGHEDDRPARYWRDCPTCGAGACIGPRKTCTRVPEAALSPANRALYAAAPEPDVGMKTRVADPARLSYDRLNAMLNAARDEGRREALSSRIFDHIVRRAGELYATGRQVHRVELLRRDIDRLADELQPLALQRLDGPLQQPTIVRLNTRYGPVLVVEADRAAICWRRPERSYGTETWERETL